MKKERNIEFEYQPTECTLAEYLVFFCLLLDATAEQAIEEGDPSAA